MYIYKEKFENQIQENMSYTQYRKWSNKKFSNGSDGKQKLITMKSNQQPMPDFEEWPDDRNSFASSPQWATKVKMKQKSIR